jgi:hypothetical protein
MWQRGRWLVVAVLVLGLLVGYALLSSGRSRPTEYWELPVGFKGWIVVEYGRPECSPLARSGDALIYGVPASGRLCTSDQLPAGFAPDRFEYVLSNGWRVVLGEELARKRRVDAASRLLAFVGTAEEEEAALKTLPAEFR